MVSTYTIFLSLVASSQSTNAYLIVDIAPGEVYSLGAGWKVKEISNLPWFESGYMLTLAASVYGTSYTVTFKPDIYGWKTPKDLKVTIQPGRFTRVVGIYEQETGALRVNLYPLNAVEAGAKWRRVGQEVWRNSGDIEEGIPLGKYRVEFYPLKNWDTPQELEVTIKDKTLITVNAYYIQHLGSLVVNIFPKEVVIAGASWKIQGTTNWLPSGFKYDNLPVGSYIVQFRDIPNWLTPSSLEIVVERDVTKSLNVEYKRLTPEEGEGEGEIVEGEGDSEGEEENGFWNGCGCKISSKQGRKLKNLFLDILFISLLIFISATSKNKGKGR